MSDDFHAVVRGPSFTGAGALPSRTHCHHVLLPMGINGSIGGSASGLPTICVMRRNAARDCVLLVCTVLPVLRWFRTVRTICMKTCERNPRATRLRSVLANLQFFPISAQVGYVLFAR